jgi:hypothetical protein
MKLCEVPGCDRPFCALGLCRGHYYRFRRTGVWPTTPLRPLVRGKGTHSRGGYHYTFAPSHPMTRRGDGYVQTHRLVAWDHGILQGPNLHLAVHHRDGDKLNNDPANLQAMTAAEHSRLHHIKPPKPIEEVCAIHDLTEEADVYRRPDGRPECRRCRREYNSRRYAERKASPPPGPESGKLG